MLLLFFNVCFLYLIMSAQEFRIVSSSLCVFSMPVIVLCRQINAQCIFIVLDLKHEATHVGRLMSAVFLLTIPLGHGKCGGGFSWVFTVTHRFLK